MRELDLTSVPSDRPMPWFRVCFLDVRRNDAYLILPGTPVTEWVDGLGYAEILAIEFDCGLKVGFEFYHDDHPAYVHANVPSLQHVRRHFRFWNNQLIDAPIEFQEPDRTAMIELHSEEFPELQALSGFQVYRMGDDGNVMTVGEPTVESDADCWVRELESHGHKQIYWYEHIA